jgi:hypothetical protein
MDKSRLAGAAMIAVAAVTVPVIAWSQSPPPSAAGAAGSGAPGGDRMDGPGGPGREGMHRGWERWAHTSPQQFCVDRLARRAGFIASLGFKLNLTAEQKPLWDKVLAATQSGQDAQRKLCETLPADEAGRDKLTAIDHLHHHAQMLQAQLQTLQQAEPAVQALYDKLSPQQKQILDHPFRRN